MPSWLRVSSITDNLHLRVTQGNGNGRYTGPAVTDVAFAHLPALVTINKGDPVTTFKYLVNQEDTDNNTQPASACQPSGAERHAEQLPLDVDPPSLRLDRRSARPVQPDDRLPGPRPRLEPGRHER